MPLFRARIAMGQSSAALVNGRLTMVPVQVQWTDGAAWTKVEERDLITTLAAEAAPLVPLPDPPPTRGVLRIVPSREAALEGGLDWYDAEPLRVPVSIEIVKGGAVKAAPGTETLPD